MTSSLGRGRGGPPRSAARSPENDAMSIECPDCGATLRGLPCDVCGYTGKKRRYPSGHDPVTDAHLADPWRDRERDPEPRQPSGERREKPPG